MPVIGIGPHGLGSAMAVRGINKQIQSVDSSDLVAPPARASLWDDEFEVSALDMGGSRFGGAVPWTLVAGVAPTLQRSWLVAPASMGLFNIRQAIAGNFRIRWRFRQSTPATANNGFAWYMSRSASTKQLMFVVGTDGTTTRSWRAERRTAYTTWNSTPKQYNFPADFYSFAPMYAEMEYDGTNCIFRVGALGIDGTMGDFPANAHAAQWYTEAAATHLGGAPDEVGMLFSSPVSTSAVYAVDWWRRLV